jgi:glutamate synthase domain-containing protein 1
VPTDNRSIGEVARGSEPFIRQVFLTGEETDPEILARQVHAVQHMRLLPIERSELYIIKSRCHEITAEPSC